MAAPAVAVLLVFHILAGIVCVLAGALAALSRKRRGRHTTFGNVYFWALAVLFVSSTAIAVLRWPHAVHLLVLGIISFAFASVGYAAGKVHWPGWTTIHVVGIGMSYVVLLTGFYVDNGPHLPLWNRLASFAFWIGPALIGLPLIALSLARHARAIEDLRATAVVFKRRVVRR
jgi:hypothetical protein